jgi:hypothetical protein
MTDPTPDAPDNYIRAVEEFLARNPPPNPLALTRLAVIHEESCGIDQGRRCDCNPRFRYMTPRDILCHEVEGAIDAAPP